jgi:hypothetical protein
MRFEGLVAPQRVSMAKLKQWVMDSIGISPWLMGECQRFSGSLNEALALVLGSSQDKENEDALRMMLEEGFGLWPSWTVDEQRLWTVQMMLMMEVDDRRGFMALLNGRSWAGVGGTRASGLGVSGLNIMQSDDPNHPTMNGLASIQVTAILLYVKPMGRSNTQYELTFGLQTHDFGDGGLAKKASLSDQQYTGCFRAVIGEDEQGGWCQGLEEEAALIAWISSNLGERIGPIRAVKVSEVFALHCEGVQWSKRHKAGFKANLVRVMSWLRGGADVCRLVDVKASLPKPQDSGQSG